MINLCF